MSFEDPSEREALLDQREIDAEMRDSRARMIAAEQRDEERHLIERDILSDERDRSADRRDVELSEREQRMTEREERAELQLDEQ